MADKVIHVHSTDQYEQIVRSGTNQLVIVDFSATWCGPCRAIAPKYSELSNNFPEAAFLHVDVDELSSLPEVATVSGVPTFKFFKAGKLVTEFAGANAAKLEQVIKDNK